MYELTLGQVDACSRGLKRVVELKKEKQMDKNDLKKLEGTEFIYHFEDGDTIKAYVKKVDLEIGITGMSLETETSMGWKPSKLVEEDGTFCVFAFNFKDTSLKVEEACRRLENLLETREYHEDPAPFGIFQGCAF